jgi:hypothetical protein
LAIFQPFAALFLAIFQPFLRFLAIFQPFFYALFPGFCQFFNLLKDSQKKGTKKTATPEPIFKAQSNRFDPYKASNHVKPLTN